MQTTNDTTKAGNARLQKDDDHPEIYSWRNWDVSPGYNWDSGFLPFDQNNGYFVVHQSQQVGCWCPNLNAAKKLLPQIDEAVVAGEVPEGCSKTSQRERQEYLAQPVEARRDKANREVRRQLQCIVDNHTRQKALFLDKAQDNTSYTIEWEARPMVKLQRMASHAETLLGVSDEDLPAAVRRCRDAMLRQLLIGSAASLSTCVFANAVEAAQRDATKAMYEQCAQFCYRYKYAHVPTEDGDA